LGKASCFWALMAAVRNLERGYLLIPGGYSLKRSVDRLICFSGSKPVFHRLSMQRGGASTPPI
jgi:hypothetical protein